MVRGHRRAVAVARAQRRRRARRAATGSCSWMPTAGPGRPARPLLRRRRRRRRGRAGRRGRPRCGTGPARWPPATARPRASWTRSAHLAHPLHAPRGRGQPARAPRGVRGRRRLLRGRARRRGHRLLAGACSAPAGAWRGAGRRRWSTATAPPCARCAASGAATPPGGHGWAAATTASRPSRRCAAAGRPGAGAGGPAARSPAGSRPAPPPPPAAGRLERGRFLALDAVLGVEELAGFALSNRPRREARAPGPRRPGRRPLPRARRPAGRLRADAGRRARRGCGATGGARAGGRRAGLTIDYREDDGGAARALALARLLVRHPLRCARDLLGRRAGAPTPGGARPRGGRLVRDGDARVHPLGGEEARAVAARLARLAGRRLET